MKLQYHAETDSLYIAFSMNPSAESSEIAEGVVLDFDAGGRLVGIDVDNASHKLDLSDLQTEHLPVIAVA
jgi:uncharacterized protein YuzE